MREGGFAPILLVVGMLGLVIFVGGAFYFGTTYQKGAVKYQTDSSPSAALSVSMGGEVNSNVRKGWAVYKSHEHGFEFQYPKWAARRENIDKDSFLDKNLIEKVTIFDQIDGIMVPDTTGYRLRVIFGVGKLPSGTTDLKSFVESELARYYGATSIDLLYQESPYLNGRITPINIGGRAGFRGGFGDMIEESYNYVLLDSGYYLVVQQDSFGLETKKVDCVLINGQYPCVIVSEYATFEPGWERKTIEFNDREVNFDKVEKEMIDSLRFLNK